MNIDIDSLPSRYQQYYNGTSGLPRWKELWYLAQLTNDKQLLEEALSLRDNKEPGLLQKAVNLAGAIVDHAKGGFVMAPQEVIDKRLETCSDCPFVNKKSASWACSKCGCNLKVKASWESSKCPLDKWDKSVQN